jgi:hypothetical protein
VEAAARPSERATPVKARPAPKVSTPAAFHRTSDRLPRPSAYASPLPARATALAANASAPNRAANGARTGMKAQTSARTPKTAAAVPAHSPSVFTAPTTSSQRLSARPSIDEMRPSSPAARRPAASQRGTSVSCTVLDNRAISASRAATSERRAPSDCPSGLSGPAASATRSRPRAARRSSSARFACRRSASASSCTSRSSST